MIRDALDHYLAGRKAFRRILPDAWRKAKPIGSCG